MVGGERIQYPYALDENENLVYIQDVLKETRHEHQYHCPECGKTMLPRLGEHNAKHFYHSENQKCGVESYIHSVAKRILAARFNDRTRPFMVSFRVHSVCCKKESCAFYQKQFCEDDIMRSFDLHKEYDLPAREEVRLKYNSAIEFQPDVVLQSSSSKHQPFYLEVWYKHKSSPEKIQSNNLIIEIRVRDISDLKDLDTFEIKESERVFFYNFKEVKVNPEAYRKRAEEELRMGLANIDYALPICLRSRDGQREIQNLQRIILYKSGKTFYQGIFEDERDKHRPSALADITYYRDRIEKPFLILKQVLERIPKSSRACLMCKHCASDIDETNRWCGLVKNGSIRKGTFKPEKASWCSFFEYWTSVYEQDSSQRDLVEGVDYTIWINPNL